MASPRAVSGWLALACAAALGACSACPPGWLAELPRDAGWTYAAGSAGPVFVDADSRNLALSRAARALAAALGIDTEQRVSVVLSDGRLFVELVGREGPTDALDDLELVELVECDGDTHALVRLPAG